MTRKLAVLWASCALACAPGLAMAQSMPQTYADVNGIPHTVVPVWCLSSTCGGGGSGGAVYGMNGTSAMSAPNPFAVQITGGPGYSSGTPLYDSIINFPTGFNALQGGAANSLTNPFYFAPSTGSQQPAPLAVTPTDRGGTITTGGTSQTLAASNTSRKGLVVQNPCNATEDLYVSTTGAASTTAGAGDDADLPACGSWSASRNGTVVQSAVTVNAATTGHAFIAKESQ